ncbi:Archaeal S-adenosylmethionine synthetase [Methanonatronarchaeum thermophilum]|uniref:Archaeal S-adenosylmethionine synthetase n=1 Tax=Methanonatronarchaeum thermophilum TaxID=1927129 RepID=A0A1Y3GBW8_9EURY|nr:methionine adenosyltransferase [Methanonatronarchaeum thermophilum]OUJ18740.1 Archaeal S-adenosylmethionine synthetase [Methanonatronarchaeum thermophilum]
MSQNKKNINVENVLKTPVEDQKVELVERKGIGHPDTIADGLAETVSQALSQEYLNRYGEVMHHNTDETQIAAGSSCPKIGGGEVIKPIYILLVGRATTSIGDEQFPAEKIALKAARKYLKEHFNHLDTEGDIIIDSKLGQSSAELREVFERDSIPKSNDTSFGVGYAPFSETEKLVYQTERYLYNLRNEIPAIGEDIKVMGLRNNETISLTIAQATVSSELDDIDHYKNILNEIKNNVHDMAVKKTEIPIEIDINKADNIEKGNIYQTVTGTSAEMGDDGSVGRGNRSNGLITPNRPMSIEATSGKNPVSHIGKIYNILSTEIANQISNEVDEIREVYVRLLSQIGQPINEPKCVSVQTIPHKGENIKQIQPTIESIVEDKLDNINKISKKVINGEIKTF